MKSYNKYNRITIVNNEIEKILDKIRKCFALSKSSNSHEAAQALKHAYALARKYNIENIEELCKITSSNKVMAASTKKLPVYLQRLASLIMNTFNVRGILSTKYKKCVDYIKPDYTEIEFYGIESDVIIAEYAWNILRRMLVNARKEYLNDAQQF